MKNPIKEIALQIEASKKQGTYKRTQVLAGPMGPTVTLRNNRQVVNLCSNDYLGLADHPEIIERSKQALDKFGNGTASVRFICGTFEIHLQLEEALSKFTKKQKATTYVSCWNANEALIPTLLGPGDVVISDQLNHASIIDACRLCGSKSIKLIYKHNDMQDLKQRLEEAKSAGKRLIVTDGVFSMEGDLANLPEITSLARDYGAIVAVDDSHAHGVLGKTGKGTTEHFGVEVDIITGTLGKALGGAAGGFVAADEPIIELLTQRSRPQLFSNALPPATAAGAIAALEILDREPQRLSKLHENVRYLRKSLSEIGYKVIESPTAIVPIIIGDTAKAIRLAKRMLDFDILITGFGYPVVPEGAARLRAQVSASHSLDCLDQAIKAFEALLEECLP
ncbi:MAG: glycine C-acetyltransferase [Sedimentisphaerales bacterium]|nr:glycine C-acetyltransferase [Sedimentisphaerales bacterium]